MKKFTVDLKSRSYPIYIEPGLVKKIPSYLSEYNKGQKWVIISQQNIMEIIGYDIEKYLIPNKYKLFANSVRGGSLHSELFQQDHIYVSSDTLNLYNKKY